MIRRAVSLLLFSAIMAQAALAAAEPIIKPRKYHGPIPRNSFTLRFGFMGGADNDEMIEALDKDIQPPFEAFSEDFSTALTIDGMYMYKLHPQFAVRGNVSVSLLSSDGNGFFVPMVTDLPDSIRVPVLDYTRNFDVDLFVVEASAIYFFSDAAIQEFQPYIGGGFSIGIPHAKFKETRIDRVTGKLFQEIARDRWSFEPGVHGLAGASYYVTNVWAVNVESRFQIMQSKFPIGAYDPDADELVYVDVIPKYSGFVLSLGVTRAF